MKNRSSIKKRGAWIVMLVAAILILQVVLDVTVRLQRPEPEMVQSVVQI